ncbi:MAG: YraN family protein [Muribaculum sp.]
MARHNDLGAWGENIAREYLITRGYTIIEHDTRMGHYEIDIIALKGNRIIFIEVKTRLAGSFDPLEAITPKKISNICRAADSFVRRYNYPHEVQFDVIAITGSPDTSWEIEHIPDAFVPPLGGYR